LLAPRKHQFAAFVRSEACLVVWSDEVDTIIESAEALELRMIQYVWASTKHNEDRSKTPLAVIGEEGAESTYDLQSVANASNVGTAAGTEKGAGYDVMTTEDQVGMGGWTELTRKRRPVYLFAPLITGLALMTNCVFVGSGIRQSAPHSFPVASALELTPLCSSTCRPARQGVLARRSLLPFRPPRDNTVHLPACYGAAPPAHRPELPIISAG
jgi:hypothetical protein